jgi:Molybdopterin cofactor-binding domain
VVKVVVRKNFVGVVAQKQWQAIQAAKNMKVRWSRGTKLPAQTSYYDYLRHQKPTRDTLTVDSRDVPEEMATATKVVKATYYYPYQMHGSMGTSCAVADVRGGHATLYSPTQGVWPLRSTAAIVLGLDPENVKVLFRRGAGCYGLNGSDTVSYDAAILSQAVGKPVRVQLSRKDEMAGAKTMATRWFSTSAQDWTPMATSCPGIRRPGSRCMEAGLAMIRPEMSLPVRWRVYRPGHSCRVRRPPHLAVTEIMTTVSLPIARGVWAARRKAPVRSSRNAS